MKIGLGLAGRWRPDWVERCGAVPLVLAAMFAGSGQHATAAADSIPAGASNPAAAVAQNAAPAVAGPGETSFKLQMNFRAAPLNIVLDYLSDAAGFVINKQTEVSGTIDAWSKEFLTREEAVELLNRALRKNGAAAIRNERVLTIVSLDSAKTADLEIAEGNDPDRVQKSSETITQIIPVRYTSASQLLNNLQPLLPTSASLSANESANSLILVATRTDIRRILKIIRALDSSIATVSSIKVYPLRYADARQLSTVVQQLFGSQSTQSSGNRQDFNFNPGGFGPFGGPPGLQPASSAASSSSGSRASKVSATADETSNSLIVSASPEYLSTISQIVDQIDQPVSDVTEVRAFHLSNADPVELADQLGQLFPDESKGNAQQQNQQGFRFGPGPPPGFGQDLASNSSTSERAKKQSRVLAVADSRSSSVIVSAASTLMPQIAKMIEQLDSSPAKKEVVKVFELKNADPNNVNQVLQDLFNRNGTMRNASSSRNSLLSQNNPLETRQTQQQQSTANSGMNLGNSTGQRSGQGGGGF